MIAYKVEISRYAVKQGVTPASIMRSIIGNAVPHLATAIRTRVQQRGDLAGQRFPGWSQRARFLATAPGYPDQADSQPGPSGAEFYRPASSYHTANRTVPGSYATSGGMWGGYSTIYNSATAATIAFRGRSIGRDPNFKRRAFGRAKKGQPRQTRQMAKALKVNNAFKAWTVFAKHGVNVLLPSDRERQAFAAGMVSAYAYALGSVLPITWQGGTVQPLPPDQAFARQRWG